MTSVAALESSTEPLIAELARKIDEVLAPLAPPAACYALVDFPDHQNVGDNAIWLGETAWLGRSGFPPPAYVCTVADYSAEALRAHAPSGPIFLHGGGNLGDLWPRHQALRERVCLDFPDRTIIQFPQSAHFETPEALDRARIAMGGHAGLHILVRDRPSLAVARTLGCRATLCPDMAFALGPQRPSAAPVHARLALMRKDKEAIGGPSELRALLAKAVVVDWPTAPPIRVDAATSDPPGVRFGAFQAAARGRLERGLELLSGGRNVITDRLHGHILCLLLGRPHSLVDNSYGKLSSFVSCWTAGAPGLDQRFLPPRALSTASPIRDSDSPV
jgi:pyruvyl transferase EpsO